MIKIRIPIKGNLEFDSLDKKSKKKMKDNLAKKMGFEETSAEIEVAEVEDLEKPVGFMEVEEK